MSEKYTIEDIRDSPPFTWTLLENKVMIGSFDTEGIAELVCKLLNENEGRKNQPRINDIIKLGLKNYLYTELGNRNIVDKRAIDEFKTAIEIISNLPCEEN